MNLPDYIASMGTRPFAEAFGVSIRTVEAWRSGRRRPSPETADRIVERSPVTWEGIYRPGGERAPGARGLRPTLRKSKRRAPAHQ